MSRVTRLGALALLFLYGLLPLEAKTAAVSLVTGAPALASPAGARLARPLTASRRRPFRLARAEDSALSVAGAGEARAAVVPALRPLPCRLEAPRPSALEGHQRFLGRERAPPA